jgi:hypothetical protein
MRPLADDRAITSALTWVVSALRRHHVPFQVVGGRAGLPLRPRVAPRSWGLLVLPALHGAALATSAPPSRATRVRRLDDGNSVADHYRRVTAASRRGDPCSAGRQSAALGRD